MRTSMAEGTSTSAPEQRLRRSLRASFEVWAQEEADRRAPWESADQELAVRMRVIEGVAVLRLEGDLHEQAISPCRNALTAALRIRTARIVVDLEAATVDEQSIPLLAEMAQVTGRHGVVLDLVGFPPVLRAALARAAAAPIRLFPAASVAVRTSLRDLPRSPGRWLAPPKVRHPRCY